MVHNGGEGAKSKKKRDKKKEKEHIKWCTMFDMKTGKIIEKKKNTVDCWWCDYPFDTLPVFLPATYGSKNGFGVFGNFCSYNCAARYGSQINDGKAQSRRTLLLNLRERSTGDTSPLRPAGDRELLIKKGGPYTIEAFRKGFSTNTFEGVMSMPPIIPLVHVISAQ